METAWVLFTVTRMILFIDEAEVSLISRKTIRGDNLDDVAFLAALPMVHEALEKIVEAFPDFRYYPPKELGCSLLSGENECGMNWLQHWIN